MAAADGAGGGRPAGAVPRLELRRLTRRFPGVLACDAVDLRVRAGEIHALFGENGAGKSTLVKMIYGLLEPDAGTILWNGTPVAIASPRAARAMGIGMVFQHFSLFDAMTVAENIGLGIDGRTGRSALSRRIRAVLATHGLALDPDRVVGTLSVGERQRIEIVRALLLDPQLLVMDEPTSVLTPQEVDQLFGTLRTLAARGCSILYISHKLNEIRALCEAATILRGGRVVGTCDPRRETSASMAERMIGARPHAVGRRTGRSFGPVRLAVEGLSLPAPDGQGTALRDIAFDLRAGEILGIAGVAGNGQTELVAALSGERPAARAEAVRIGGVGVGLEGPGARRARGLSAVPEERNGHAAVPAFTLAENTLLTARGRRRLAPFGLIRHGRARAFARAVIDRFGVRAAGPDALAGSLSGGNLQKFVMGREILQAPEVLVAAQPTWGVDAGAAAAIHQALVDLAAAGSAILLVSQDLDELLALADGLMVINGGRLSRRLEVAGARVRDIGLLMGGIHGAPAAARDAETAHAG